VRLAALLLAAALAAPGAEPPPDPRRGLYAIWLRPGQPAGQTFLKGGQAVAQWSDVEPAEGKYDFSTLDRQLEAQQKAGRAATVQVNGNRHPEWLFGRVPSTRKKLSKQVNDPRGTLAYWHPAYQEAYRRLVLALGAHLRASPLGETVLGVRLNFNALGTEHYEVPEEDRDPSRWTAPEGSAPPGRWSRETGSAYRNSVVGNFTEAFLPQLRVFLRNNLVNGREEAPGEILPMLEEGKLALFHTSSEMEPRKGNSAQYESFLRYCRSGKTVCYAEPWADAWGRHGGQTDPRWCGPEQFNWWRLLADLNCGVSFIALYGADLEHAAEPEFRAAFEFAARYAGHHASPSTAPGAWVALREGNTLKGDYTFLMRRSGLMTAFEKQGPPEQRQGAWARRLEPGSGVRFELDAAFARSLKGDATILVTYLDSGRDELRVECGARRKAIRLEGTGRWRTDSWTADASGGEVRLQADGGVALHMVEVRR
jgi:hypothetical protein